MKLLFYPRLAWTGIRKNRRLYLPYLLTCIGMVMMEYIICFLKDSEAVRGMRGAMMITGMMSFGSFVIAVFALIFLFYTNSFLMRRRKKEFGLYSILGMSRRNLGRILLWETLFVLVISLAAGLFAGAALSKLAELILLNMLHGKTTYSLTLSAPAATFTLCVFLVIFALLFLKSLWQVRSLDALSLLKSESVGEKPPRANWALGLLGLLVLGAGYALAVYVGDRCPRSRGSSWPSYWSSSERTWCSFPSPWCFCAFFRSGRTTIIRRATSCPCRRWRTA